MPRRLTAPRGSRSHRYEYRLRWAYVGNDRIDPREHRMLAQTPAPILRMLRRIATDRPWEGTTKGRLRKAWMRLWFMLDVPWSEVARLPIREAVKQIQCTYPKLDWVSVEWRQVGTWTEMLDPLVNLRGDSTTATDHAHDRFLTSLDAMTQEELDTWRWTPGLGNDPGAHAVGGLAYRKQRIAADALAAARQRKADYP